jgi:L-asparaginase II
MLGLARLKGWPLESYLEPDHPLQRRMLEEVARFTGMSASDIAEVVDGCGMVAFGVPLVRMAVSFAALAASASVESGPARIVEAMTSHPFLLGGSDRLCTALPTASKGRILGKLGAEGIYGVAIPSEGLGIAVKIEDGGFRALDPAVLRVLEHMDLLSEPELEGLGHYRRKPVRNTLGVQVGEIRAEFDLKPSVPA